MASSPCSLSLTSFEAMAPMKAVKVKKLKAVSKADIATRVAESTGLKKSAVTEALSSLADVGATEVKKTGKFVLPGLVMIKARTKAATKAGKKILFGKETTVKAHPAKTVVKAFPVKALKDQF